MSKKTPPFQPYPQWTTSRFFTFIRSALRQAWNRYPPKYEALKAAQSGSMTNKSTGKMAMHFKCAECGNLFVQKEVQVDHIIDVGALKSFSDLPGFVERMFCSSYGLRVICKECHHKKTYNK